MAKIDSIAFNRHNSSDKTDIINVSSSVGVRGVNHTDDVIVVQALLKYALEHKRDFRNEEFPEPCGAFLKTTSQLIKKYQRYHNRNGSLVSIDGRIDPAEGSAYAKGSRKFWTIYALNIDAVEAAFLSGRKSAIDGVCSRWPFIKKILNKNGVGTLNLELE
jgi:hypothetical protein